MVASGLGICHLWKITSEDPLGSDILYSIRMVHSTIQSGLEMRLLANNIF